MGNSKVGNLTFLCLECGVVIDQPEGKNGFLRCHKGHRVQVLKSLPLWVSGLISFAISFWILSAIIHLFQTVWASGYTPLITWSLLGVAGAWGIYLTIQGRLYTGNPAPIGTMGRQYVTVGIGKVVAATVLGAIAAMQISY